MAHALFESVLIVDLQPVARIRYATKTYLKMNLIGGFETLSMRVRFTRVVLRYVSQLSGMQRDNKNYSKSYSDDSKNRQR